MEMNPFAWVEESMLERDALSKLNVWLVNPSGVEDTLPWLAAIRDSEVYCTYVIDVANVAGCSQSDVERYVDRFMESRQQRKADAYARLNNKLNAMGVSRNETKAPYPDRSGYSDGYNQDSGYNQDGGYNQSRGRVTSKEFFDSFKQTVTADDYEGEPCDFCGTPCRMRAESKLTTAGLVLTVIFGLSCSPLILIPLIFMRKKSLEEYCPRYGCVNSIDGKRLR